MHETGQPVLVGTVTIETSEYLSDLLKRRGIEHEVLNAKQHEQRSAHRRRGRAARRGDDRDEHGRSWYRHHPRRQPETVTEDWQQEHDDVVASAACTSSAPSATSRAASTTSCAVVPDARATRAPRASSSRSRTTSCAGSRPTGCPACCSRLGMDENSRSSQDGDAAIENAQSKVEAYNFDIRKHVVEYDDVMNMHRDVIYTERTKVLEGEYMRDNVFGWSRRVGSSATPCSAQRRGLGPRPPRSTRPARSSPIEAGSPTRSMRSDSADEIEATRARRGRSAYDEKTSRSAKRACACSSACSCSRPSTASGSSTSRPWTRCARASG